MLLLEWMTRKGGIARNKKEKFLTRQWISTHLHLLMLNTADTGPAPRRSVTAFKLAIPQTQWELAEELSIKGRESQYQPGMKTLLSAF